ncbi:MAG: beta-ketoacyl-[acyl-carrier-protein] synthase II [Thermodesulfovibrio sp.]|nr:beta-ketoacyl-[acyl-carrier-protein] synthase II [Thermodesulfovibrio sp.]
MIIISFHMKIKRVVITGIGAVTPLGNTFGESWEAALSGRSGLSPVSRFDRDGRNWKLAGELRQFDPHAVLSAKEAAHFDPFVHYAVSAAAMAVADAGLAVGDYLGSGGVIIGSSRGGISTLERAVSGLTGSGREKGRRLSPYLMPATTISAAPSFCAQKIGIRGHCLGISNACASGSNAIGEAFRLIQKGHEGPVLAGGTEAPLCRLCLEGYGSSGALSKGTEPSASRPFDRERDGFVLSEGACILVLESLENALKRDVRIYAEIMGYANTVDAFHLTKPDSAGEAGAISAALRDAGVAAGAVDYINTHGTSTVLGDAAEAKALQQVFGARISEVPASALKSMTGHMLAASGALETAFTAVTLQRGIIPPSINLEEKDAACHLNIITAKSDIPCSIAITQSFGFGGVNAVLVLKRFQY